MCEWRSFCVDSAALPLMSEKSVQMCRKSRPERILGGRPLGRAVGGFPAAAAISFSDGFKLAATLESARSNKLQADRGN